VISEPIVPPAVLARIRAPFLERRAEPVEPPVLQPLNLLLDLAGESMRARLFVVQGEGGEELCLRPDFTVPVVRGHVAEGRAEGRYLYEGQAFRVASAGRAQEFRQIGLETLGETASPEADADIAALAWSAAAAGGRTDLSLVLGDLGLFDAFAAGLEIPPVLTARLRRSLSSDAALRDAFERSRAPETRRTSPVAALLAGRPEAEAAALLEELWSMMGVGAVAGRSAAEIARRLVVRQAEAETPAFTPANAELMRRYLAIDDTPPAALDAVAGLAREAGVDLDGPLDAWARRLAAMERAGVPSPGSRLVIGFGRVFDYYDGFLFEVRSGALAPDQPIAAGGRYDRLPPALGARAAGAVGCMVRPARAWSGA
jgi:ATP phosphoribosyltransferase regulatory subunit